MIKVLSIGNSFSQDAQHFLHDLSMHGEEEIYCVNLYIGGCSLETHAANIKSDKKAYLYEVNGKQTDRYRGIEEVLTEENWDFVTLQQASWLSGKEETYIPYFDEIYNFVKSKSDAQLLMHETWAYETDENLPPEKQQEMYNNISKTYKKFANEYNMQVIPVGDVIQQLRKTPEFDYSAGQPSLNRDGQHLGLGYGGYVAALIWYKVITGKSVEKIGFLPYEFVITNDSMNKIKKIKEIVENI